VNKIDARHSRTPLRILSTEITEIGALFECPVIVLIFRHSVKKHNSTIFLSFIIRVLSSNRQILLNA